MKKISSVRLAPETDILTLDDVLKARLKTVGVAEYKFEMEVSAGRDSGTEWRIVDVGGSRSQVGFPPSMFPTAICSNSIFPSTTLIFIADAPFTFRISQSNRDVSTDLAS